MAADRLAEFLRKRLAESEAAHLSVHGQGCASVTWSPGPVQCDCGWPARVLREVEAKRKILDRHKRGTRTEFLSGGGVLDETPICLWCVNGFDNYPWPCPDVRAVAAVDSDHPDYDKAWAAQ